jgi:hypothetical protein
VTRPNEMAPFQMARMGSLRGARKRIVPDPAPS